jgi:hypothetical protein
VLDRIHAERLAAGDFQTIGVSERLPKSGDGVFVESTVSHDANRNEDVRRVTTVTWRQDPRLQSAYEDLEALKSGLRAMLLNNMNPKIASGARDKR